MKSKLTTLLLAVAMTATAQPSSLHTPPSTLHTPPSTLPPTMGWSSWNTFALNINEQLIRQQADAMHTLGLQEAGYEYVNIDDGYWDGRGPDGHLRLNTKLFPSGMRPLVDYIHSLGLKAGIYSDAGDNTCGSGNKHAWGLGVGLAGHEAEDCQLYFRDWDFDFIKVDYCGGAHMGLDEREQYTKISNAIRQCGKPGVVFNICRWAYPGTWVADISDSWRTTGDIYDAWKSVKSILAENLYLSAYCHDGHYNDMDMLEVGRSMTQTEDETHFGMWCIMASPLLIGCDMTTLKDKPQTLALLTNKDLISLNQDPLHLQAYVAEKQNDCFVLVKDIKTLHGKQRAVAVYNPTDEEKYVTLRLSDLELGGDVVLRDCVSGTVFDLKKQADGSAVLGMHYAPHGTRFYIAECKKRLERTVYEAETAWLSCYQELRNNQNPAPISQHPTAIYGEHAQASGGYVARFLGQSEENDLQWQHVYVKKGGSRQLTITYFCGEDRQMDLTVNGQHVATLRTHSRDWTRPATISLPVNLRKGDNVIRLSNANGWMPDIDKMTLQ